MNFEKLEIVPSYDSLSINRVIYPLYNCNCTKDFKGTDKFVVYSAIGSEINKVFETNLIDFDENCRQVLPLLTNITDKLVVSGGHTVVNLKDRFHVGNEVIKSVDFSFKLIKEIENKRGIQSSFLMMLNDFYMEKDAGADAKTENKYRKEALSPYITPTAVNEYIVKYSKELGHEINCLYCSEKNMADRFKRHIQNQKKSNEKSLFTQKGNDWIMTVGDNSFAVIENNKPNCPAGNAATYRAIRYEAFSNKLKDNFTSYIGIFPLCSLTNVLNGYIAADAFYDNLDLPTYFIFFGKSCF